jgi:hypothetical protein
MAGVIGVEDEGYGKQSLYPHLQQSLYEAQSV